MTVSASAASDTLALPSSTTSSCAPVYQYDNWKKLHAAAIRAFRPLAALTQKQFIAMWAPAASLALWVLQHRPELAVEPELELLMLNAGELEGLDSGRWLQFIPWLLGRPQLQVRATLVGKSLIRTGKLRGQTLSDARLAQELQSVASRMVQSRAPARLIQAPLSAWHAMHRAKDVQTPHVCAMFGPSLLRDGEELLCDEGLWPLLRAGVPMALFSTSEPDRAVDVHMLESAGLTLVDRDAWEPNPWVMPNQAMEKAGAHLMLSWSLEVARIDAPREPMRRAAHKINELLDLVQPSMHEQGADAVLALGERLVLNDNLVLVRLPNNLAVEHSSGRLFQLQGNLAFEVQPAFSIPSEAFVAEPKERERLLERPLWAADLYQRHVAPHVQWANDADERLTWQRVEG